MSIQDIIAASIAGGGGLVAVLMTLIQVSPLKVNPWSAIGRALNKDVITRLDATSSKLEEHIRLDDERNADMHRARILQFNTELLRNIRHTEEDFNEILYNIDCYEQYCRAHEEYKNNRAVHAIMNIKRVYDECLEAHNFL